MLKELRLEWDIESPDMDIIPDSEESGDEQRRQSRAYKVKSILTTQANLCMKNRLLSLLKCYDSSCKCFCHDFNMHEI